MIEFIRHRRSAHSMRRLYDHIYRFYGVFEWTLGPKIDQILQEKIAILPDLSSSTALEYACGTGLLSLKLATMFKSVRSYDFSTGMLERAKAQARKVGSPVNFYEGDLLDIREPANSYDYVFVSFALHLFPSETEKEILKRLCLVARKSVFIIDHGRKWSLGIAFFEWLEGSYYDQFIQTEFKEFSQEIGCKRFEEIEIEGLMVLHFSEKH